MSAYVVCSARPGRAIEVLGTYVESGDAARACAKSGAGAHVVRSGALLRFHDRTARAVIVATEKALREKTHPALTYEGTPIAPEPEADEQPAEPIEEVTEEPSAPEAPRVEPKPEPTKPRQATKRSATKRTRSATKQPRKTARRVARDSADGTLADLATILRQAERHGSIARLLADAALGRAVRRALGPVG